MYKNHIQVEHKSRIRVTGTGIDDYIHMVVILRLPWSPQHPAPMVRGESQLFQAPVLNYNYLPPPALEIQVRFPSF